MLLLSLWILPAHAQPAPAEIAAHLDGLEAQFQQALEASRAAASAPTVAAVKRHADAVFATVWGVPSGLVGDARGAAAIPGWKVRWQTNNDAFDEEFAERYGTTPPAVTDPARLGIVGRGRYVRAGLQAMIDDEKSSAEARGHAEQAIEALNNVIGWMRMDDGVTKGERQPRVDLTYRWDAPTAFWLGTADTGWLHEAYAQALNILKTDYGDDLGEAQTHAAALVAIFEQPRKDLIAPIAMERGFNIFLDEARAALGQ